MVAVTKNLIDISLTTTGNTSLGDWDASSEAIDTEVYKQAGSIGTDGSYNYQTGKNTLATAILTLPTNEDMTSNYTYPHLYWVMRCDVFPFCEDLNTSTTNSGLMVRVTDGSGNWTQWHVTGADQWDGGWRNFVLDLTNTADVHTSSGTLSLADVDIITFYTDASNSGNIRIVDNTWIDCVRYGDGLQIESATTEAFNFLDIAEDDVLVANYYTVIQKVTGILAAQGGMILGDDTGSATCNLVSLNEQIVFQNNNIRDGFYEIRAVASATATTDIDIQGAIWSNDGPFGPHVDWTDPDIGTVLFNGTMLNLGEFLYVTGQDCKNITYVGCEQITPDGADIRGSTVSGYEGTDNTSAIVYNNSADPDGEFDGLTITKGAAATHAIEFGVDIPADITLRNCIFSGYNASDTQDDSTFHFKDTGGTITINLIGCTGEFSYRSDGATIDVVIAPVTVTIKVLDDSTGLALQFAHVWIGKDSDKSELLNDATDVNGEVTFQYTYVADLDIVGWARQMDLSGTDYVQKDFSGTITDAGFSLTIRLEPIS